MPRAALAAFALAGSLLVHACDETAGNRSVAELPKRTLTVGAQDFEMRLPSSAVVTTRAGTTRIDFAPGTRRPRTIDLTLAGPAGSVEGKTTTRRLASGATLTYAIRTDAGGSGGTEATLTGRLKLDAVTLAILCRSQGELAVRGDWCLSYLGAMRKKDR